MKSELFKSTYLEGLQDYSTLLDLQLATIQSIREQDASNTLFLLEHKPIYTMGSQRDQSSLRDSNLLPHPVYQIQRGGEATYHGPGQLVGYPILNLKGIKQDLHLYLRAIEESLILTCEVFGVPAQRKEGFTGVWVRNKKMASIGVGVKQWISYHGFAINITPESLNGFMWITPCGIDEVQMTCLNDELPSEVPAITTHEFASKFTPIFEQELIKLKHS